MLILPVAPAGAGWLDDRNAANGTGDDDLAERRRIVDEALREYDYAAAYPHLLVLAEAGDRQAYFVLGLIYEWQSDVVETDYVIAAGWYLKAAKAGSVDCWCNLCLLYAKGGHGLERDVDYAIECLRHAAKLGSKFAKQEMERLGLE
jgi:TPR repeat protein